jgi:hypothetical protein
MDLSRRYNNQGEIAMRQTIRALARASLLCALVSAPLIALAEQPKPVVVTNPVLPVEVSNAEPIPVAPTTSTSALSDFFAVFARATANTVGPYEFAFALPGAVTLTSLVLEISAEGTAGLCQVGVNLEDTGEPFATFLHAAFVRAGQYAVSPLVEFPNLAVPDGTTLVFRGINGVSGDCDIQVNLKGLNVQ